MKTIKRHSKVDKTTKREVVKATAEAIHVDMDDIKKRVITDATVRIRVERQYSGGSDATSFEVRDDISYSEIITLISPTRKKI